MRLLALLFVPIFGFCSIAVAAEDVDCSTLEDAEARLACFDARFPQNATAEPSAVEPGSVAPVIVSEPVVSVEAQDAQIPESAPTPPAASDEVVETGFLGDTGVDLTSTIRTIRAGEKQKMVFLLDNDEIWMQSSPRPLPFDEGDIVSIKNAKFGGYFMRSEDGVSTRVQRIR